MTDYHAGGGQSRILWVCVHLYINFLEHGFAIWYDATWTFETKKEVGTRSDQRCSKICLPGSLTSYCVCCVLLQVDLKGS